MTCRVCALPLPPPRRFGNLPPTVCPSSREDGHRVLSDCERVVSVLTAVESLVRGPMRRNGTREAPRTLTPSAWAWIGRLLIALGCVCRRRGGAKW